VPGSGLRLFPDEIGPVLPYARAVGTIVVGVDGSPGSLEALRFAVAEARLRGVKLRVVHAWTVPLAVALPEPAVLAQPLIPEPEFEQVRAALLAQGDTLLDEALAGVDMPEVERVLVEGTPAHALVQTAEGADLLVVGSRGRGGFRGLLLGSVSQQCAHHAPCPIVIVPAPR